MPIIALAPAVPYAVAGAKVLGSAIAGFFTRKVVVEVGKAAVVTGGAYVVSQMSADDEANDNATPVTGTDTENCTTGKCDEEEKRADDPGQPGAEEGYKPPKKWDGKKVKNPNGQGKGWPDKNGDVWVPTGHGPTAHGGPHWDVQTPGGGYRNVYPGGRVR